MLGLRANLTIAQMVQAHASLQATPAPVLPRRFQGEDLRQDDRIPRRALPSSFRLAVLLLTLWAKTGLPKNRIGFPRWAVSIVRGLQTKHMSDVLDSWNRVTLRILTPQKGNFWRFKPFQWKSRMEGPLTLSANLSRCVPLCSDTIFLARSFTHVSLGTEWMGGWNELLFQGSAGLWWKRTYEGTREQLSWVVLPRRGNVERVTLGLWEI